MPQSASQNVDPSEYLGEDIQSTIDDFKKLSADDQLALLYYVYEKMGDSITPAAPQAAEPELAPILLGDFYNLSHQDQLQVMRDIVNRTDTEYSRAYGALKENNQLLVWYVWAVAMGESVVGMPAEYEASEGISNLLKRIEGLEFEQQISLLRELASEMGYTGVQAIPSQAQTGKTASL
ncbi:orange carotenoid protein N-terminal domain-containing protein [Leptolyngbya sp. AN03gr2]|uniref:orange carotenoid protein N-terminal domain-containing protein n=1 Tax=unclassified Leptolyngbya TaxID=2650499 RepID=UPI003D31E58A